MQTKKTNWSLRNLIEQTNAMWCSMTCAGERPQSMKIMSGMLLISAHNPETMAVRVFPSDYKNTVHLLTQILVGK